ncbi:hypothetical protein JEQ12_015961 [Ovis aries]|uniref:DUF3456 domain-containing protein n=1 Tax=Ovis aries TaxID=9940 RepID=A0A836AJC0_SHEEP|nr:hypothetical protein JEQ12_015961 [Ovis aries]
MMRSLRPVVLLALLVLLAGLPAARDPREPDVFCGACRALMDEVEYDVTKARQEKTKVGSFRINPDGTQERRKGISSKLLLSPGGPKGGLPQRPLTGPQTPGHTPRMATCRMLGEFSPASRKG